MPIDRDGEGPPLRRQDAKVSLTPGDVRSADLRATPFTDDVFTDDYYGRRRATRPARSGTLGILLGVTLGIVVAAGAGWYVLRGSGLTFTPGDVGFIKAEPTPYKVRPDAPGGLQVENQDKLVYDRVAKGSAPNRVENLLPPAEEPKAPPPQTPQAEAPPKDLTAPAAEAKPEEPPKPSNVVQAPEAPKVAPTPAAPQPDPLAAAVAAATGGRTSATGPIAVVPKAVPSPEPAKPALPADQAAAGSPSAPPPVAAVTPDVAKSADVAAATSTAPPTPPAAEGTGPTFQIQLASVLSEEAALAEWKRIGGKHKELLGGLTPAVTRADLGDRGVFYRLRAGPLADKAAAEAMCSSLAAEKVGCIVVKP